jgi:hypothetical protein
MKQCQCQCIQAQAWMRCVLVDSFHPDVGDMVDVANYMPAKNTRAQSRSHTHDNAPFSADTAERNAHSVCSCASSCNGAQAC